MFMGASFPCIRGERKQGSDLKSSWGCLFDLRRNLKFKSRQVLSPKKTKEILDRLVAIIIRYLAFTN
jgi:hypothetical protein